MIASTSRLGADPLNPVVCFGEAIVDHYEPASGALSGTRRLGGACANAAVVASRWGADVALVAAAGDDAEGRWLRRRLQREKVDLRWWRNVAEACTPCGLVRLGGGGAAYSLRDAACLEPLIVAVGDTALEAVERGSGLLVTGNSLVGPAERSATRRAVAHARRLRRPLVVDAGLRAHRWSSMSAARDEIRWIAQGCRLFRANADEARVLTGTDHKLDAARTLRRELDCGAVVVTHGACGATLAGRDAELTLSAEPTCVIDPTGAGDAVTGTLLAALARSAFDVSTLPDALSAALRVAAMVTGGHGAVDPLPLRLD